MIGGGNFFGNFVAEQGVVIFGESESDICIGGTTEDVASDVPSSICGCFAGSRSIIAQCVNDACDFAEVLFLIEGQIDGNCVENAW